MYWRAPGFWTGLWQHCAVADAQPGPDVAAATAAPTRESRLEILPPPTTVARLHRRVATAPRDQWVLAALIVLWVTVFGDLVLLRQNRYGSFSLDMAIFDQATWLISRMGGLFITIRGLHFFGHHFNLGLFLLAPFYWVGAGANFLNLVMVTAMALATVPIYLLARDRLGSGWLGVGLAAAFLLHPSLQFMAWELFHPEPMALVGLFFAWWFAWRERWAWYAVSLVYAVCWKEDVALAALVIGLVLLARRQWKPGLWTVALSGAYFVMVNSWLIPTFSGVGQAFYNSNFFGTLGNSPSQVLVNSARHPSEFTRRVLAPDAKTFYWQMAMPFAFIPLAAPLALAVGVPQALIDVLSTAGFTRVITYHYAALPLAGLTLGAVEGVAFLGRRRLLYRQVLVGAILVCSLVSTVLWGPSPIGSQYRKGWWPLWPDASRQAKSAAVREMAGKDHISATYDLAPHLAHRRYVYSYPNPFISDNWAVNGEHLPDPNIVHWLVLNRALVDGRNTALLDRLVSDGEFEIVSDDNGVVVAHRVRPGSRIDPDSFGLGP